MTHPQRALGPEDHQGWSDRTKDFPVSVCKRAIGAQPTPVAPSHRLREWSRPRPSDWSQCRTNPEKQNKARKKSPLLSTDVTGSSFYQLLGWRRRMDGTGSPPDETGEFRETDSILWAVLTSVVNNQHNYQTSFFCSPLRTALPCALEAM